MTKKDKIDAFDPNGFAQGDEIFGLPFNFEESETIVLGVEWEATVSYRTGTSNGPDAILEASKQIDLFDAFLKDAWKDGIYYQKLEDLQVASERTRQDVEKYLDLLERDVEAKKRIVLRDSINQACADMVYLVEEKCTQILKKNKRLILLGGDHSTPLGYLKALNNQGLDFGILQIDAHADLRKAYEDLEYSHASIMYNALKLPSVKKLVQIGIRDFCEAEFQLAKDDDRITTFYDRDLKKASYNGAHWADLCEEFINELPERVYISFDIDGLDPKLCPNTGTPVAGGFELEQIVYLFEQLAISGKKIIGMDLNEVSPGQDEWDASVGARLLYKMANIFSRNHKK